MFLLPKKENAVTTHVVQNAQSVSVGAHLWDADSLAFAGTSSALGQTPTATFTGLNTLVNVKDTGTTVVPGTGVINLMPASSLTTGGLTVTSATLWVNERPGDRVTFNGNTSITQGATLTATGYANTGAYSVNGTMTIDGTSTVNMDYVAVSGGGKFHLTGANALLRAGTVSAGETIVLDSGKLSLANGMNFLGTITDSSPTASRIGATSSVEIYNAMTAVRETFNRTTGALDLFDKLGSEVAHLKFAGSGTLYAAPTTGLATNYMAITSHSTVGALTMTINT
jgi:hypothetical protein